MEFIKSNELISMKLDGVSAFDYLYTVKDTENGNTLRREYLFEDSLKVVSSRRKIEGFDAYEWVNSFTNVSDSDTRVISELYDVDITVPWEHAEPRPKSPWLPRSEWMTSIHTTRGSISSDVDFSEEVTRVFPGDFRQYAPRGGRSTDNVAPYFNINRNGVGLIVVFGWTGQWNARFDIESDAIKIRAKIEDTEFKMLPGESFRTLSAVVMRYEGDAVTGQNIWRRLMRREFSKPMERVGALPICANFWGGLESQDIIDRVKIYADNKVPFDAMWIDAGWGGRETLPTKDEFTGDWYSRVGDWRISPIVHPNGMSDVREAIRSSEYGFVLWFEPERARDNTEMVKLHPEYFLSDGGVNRLLNLGDEKAYAYIKDAIFGIIEKLGVTWYRQDFNFQPLPFFRANDKENRRGITEIKHINALYRFFDEMLEKFPNLMIDNCASGGRRLDIEMMKRSFPLWRSDAQCPADPMPEITQVNTVNFARWLPYTASGAGRVYDTYRVRSAYSPGMGTNFGFSKTDDFTNDPEKIGWIKERVEELRTIKRYFTDGDLYVLTKPVVDFTSWLVSEWVIPEENTGMLQVFKRENSPYTSSSFALRGIDESKTYTVTDLDGGSFDVSGEELATGFSISIEESRVAKIFVFTAKE